MASFEYGWARRWGGNYMIYATLMALVSSGTLIADIFFQFCNINQIIALGLVSAIWMIYLIGASIYDNISIKEARTWEFEPGKFNIEWGSQWRR
jgi:hypothetical protein